MTLIQYPQGRCGAEIEAKILALERTAWPESGEEVFPSAPGTYVTSFIMLEGDEAVCHVGIRRSTLCHKGRTYLAYGLSEVVTHPRFRNQGIASEMLRLAAGFISAQRPDISIFTCERGMVPFYTRGGWEAVEGACFVGGAREKPFRSDELDLVTMMMFLSPKGELHRRDFEHTDIVFELGEGELW